MIGRYKKRFYKFDKESKGFITTVDVQQVLEVGYLLQFQMSFLNILDWNKKNTVSVCSKQPLHFQATIFTIIFFFLHIRLFSQNSMLVKISCTKNKM